MTVTAPAVTKPPVGLTGEEARRRLAQTGPNAIVDVREHPVRRALAKLWAPIPWMLEGAILLELGLGDYIEAGVVAFLLLFNALLAFFQEGRAEATLDALKARLALLASVQRDGKWSTIAATDLVPGDLVKLSLGTVVAADMRLLTGQVLLDQSMLTGESLPVEAVAGTETYAGALVRRGEAVGQVLATGARTKFGRTAELVRTAKVESTEQKAILRVVRNLALFNGGVTLLLTAYALWLPMPTAEIFPLILVAILASIPVALPSMFTLAATVGARALAAGGILPTSLSSVDEAGCIDILCADKTGTLTRNELAVMAVEALAGSDKAHVLAMAALASSDGGQDPVDAAIRKAAADQPVADGAAMVSFLPFDPATKRAEATVRQATGVLIRVVKGAYEVVKALAQTPPAAADLAGQLQAKGYRILAVAAGPADKLDMIGLIALSDPPRADSAALVAELGGLGVRVIMVTGDALITAEVVASAIGITGRSCATTPLPDNVRAADFAVFAGVLPEDKYRLVKALQKTGHTVGMCGDGANDAPALRQAQMGIAVFTATDVAKSSAGIVLTKPGLGGIVAAIKEGRTTFQRILTYTMRTLIHKVVQVLFLAIGLVITGQAILTPMLMVLMMVIGDFLAMSTSTDHVRPSPKPNVWRIGNLTIACVILGLFDLAFCVGCFATGKYLLGLDPIVLRTLTVVTLVFSGQAVLYIARERRHIWSSMPGRWMVAASVADVAIICFLAGSGILMLKLSLTVVAALFAATVVFALILDTAKVILFRRLQIA